MSSAKSAESEPADLVCVELARGRGGHAEWRRAPSECEGGNIDTVELEPWRFGSCDRALPPVARSLQKSRAVVRNTGAPQSDARAVPLGTSHAVTRYKAEFAPPAVSTGRINVGNPPGRHVRHDSSPRASRRGPFASRAIRPGRAPDRSARERAAAHRRAYGHLASAARRLLLPCLAARPGDRLFSVGLAKSTLPRSG